MIARVVDPGTMARRLGPVGRGTPPVGSMQNTAAMLLARRAVAGFGLRGLGGYDIAGLANASAAGQDPFQFVNDYNAWEGPAGVLAQIQAYQAAAANLTDSGRLQVVGSSLAGQALMVSLAQFPSVDSNRVLDALQQAMNAGKGQMGVNSQPVTPAGQVQFTPAGGNPGGLKVGEGWRLMIVGPINGVVSVYGGKNGVFSEVVMGHTDSRGVWTTTGQATADQVGSWQELWKVNGQAVGQLNFTISAPTVADQSTGPAGAPPSSGAPATDIPVSIGIQQVTLPGATSGSSATDFLTKPLGPLPLWVWLAAGGAAMVFGRGR